MVRFKTVDPFRCRAAAAVGRTRGEAGRNLYSAVREGIGTSLRRTRRTGIRSDVV
jgi:hypothetical protein